MRKHWEEVGRMAAERPAIPLWRTHMDQLHCRLLARWGHGARHGKVLKTDLYDEACGTGLWETLAASSRLVIGLDWSESILRSARIRHHALVLQADVRCIPVRDQAFHRIVSNSTLDHFHSADQIALALGELYRVLRTGGELLLTLDNGSNPVVRLRNVLPFAVLRRLGLVPYYSGATLGPRQMRDYLEKAGFQVVEIATFLHCPRLPAVALAGRLGESRGNWLLPLLMKFELLERLPTRFMTGYYVAARAIRRMP